LSYPNLDGVSRIVLDIETGDRNLKEQGPGVYRKDGYIVGVALALDNGFKEFYPFTDRYGEANYWINVAEFNSGHKTVSAEIAGNIEFIRYVVEHKCDKIGAKILYDLDWLVNGMSMKFNSEIWDIQVIEPLLNEYSRSTSLEVLSQKYLGISKKTDILENWARNNDLTWKNDVRSIIYKFPVEIVGEYALGDVGNTLGVLDEQMKEVHRLELDSLLTVERKVTKILLKMRAHGVRIDKEKAERNLAKLKRKIGGLKLDFYNEYGDYNVNSGVALRKLFSKLDLPVPTNIDKKEGFDQKAIAYWVKDPVGKKIIDIRKAEKAYTYIENSILGYLTPDMRIHPAFNQLSMDEYGTVSGRFSGSKPNLQQVSHVIKKPHEKDFEDDYGVMLRGCFIPEEGKDWVKMDFKQIEYMFILHYGIGPTAELTRRKIIADPTLDFHTNTGNMTGITDRREVKEINFGEAYFIGAWKIAFRNGWTIERAYELMDKLRKRMPFIRDTANRMLEIARIRDAETRGQGFLRTIAGRYARVSPTMRAITERNGRKGDKMYPLFNRIIQGGAADMFKTSLVNIDEAGIFDVIGVPHLLVHDENDMSVAMNDKIEKEAMLEMKHIMENSIKLKVPVQVEYDVGPDWGHVREFEEVTED
jgi:DNA polymerase I